MKKTWTFNTGNEGFGYLDDSFRMTKAPAYAAGAWASVAGYDGKGALAVRLGGVDETDIAGMSGGWRTSFALDTREDVTLTFRVKLTQTASYERNEYSEALIAVDGRVQSVGVKITGDGPAGNSQSTGWKLVTVDLGELAAGRHTLTLGGFNNAKTEANEVTTLTFDDVSLAGTPVGSGGGSGGGTGGIPLAAFEARVLELTNEFRAANGKAPFENDARLNAAAESWSASMASGDYFRHSSPAQVEKQGYDWTAWGENIAAGYATPEAVVNGWINSPGHRANMLSDKFEEMGVGYVNLANDTGSVNYRHYWTQVFGTEADSLV